MAAKPKRSPRAEKKNEKTFFNSFSLDKYIPIKYQTLFLLLIILLIFYIFYSPLYFGSKEFQSADIITKDTAIPYLEKHQEEEGYTLWNPYVFCGMPAYAIALGYKSFNLNYRIMYMARKISVLHNPFKVDYVTKSSEWAFYLILLAVTMFIFMLRRTNNKLISLLTSIATSFCTGIVVFLYIGHTSKLTAIWAFPLLLMQLINFQTKIRPIDVILTIVIIAMMFLGWHVQIIFYIFFAVLIYFIYFFIRSFRIKDKFLTKQLVKSVAVFLLAIFIGLLIQSDSFTQILEYNPYSTRGTESILEKQKAPNSQSESDFYKYATDWSFSPGEVLTMVIPSYYGFGKSTYQGPLSQNQPVEVNTYFGQMPFVDVAVGYMSVIIFFLAIFSMIINWKDPFVRYLTILAFIALLISFGRTFPVLFDLMFDYFPAFGKFRVPSMILVLVHLSFPILAGLGLAKIVSLRKEPDKKIEALTKNIMLVFGGLLLITLFLASPIKDWFIDRVISSGQRGNQMKVLHDYMADMFIGDARLAFLFSTAVFGLIYLYIKSKLSADLMILLISGLIFIDLVRIDWRGETYVENSSIEQMFAKPEYVQAIESVKDSSVYRILNIKQDRSVGSVGQNSNFNAYFLQQDLFGYSAIKPRAFQDYMDVLNQNPANPTLWRMANVKYLVFDSAVNSPALKLIYSGNKNFVYQNMNVLPRAYFVNQVQTRTAIQILSAVRGNKFDPRNVAFIENDSLTADKPDSTAFVKIDSYKDEKIKLSVNASGNNFLFLGDTYYSGSTEYKIPILNIPLFTSHRWRAYVDGNETRIYRTNHDFRGVIVPKGRHNVVFYFLPESFNLSTLISRILSYPITSLVIGYLLWLFFRWLWVFVIKPLVRYLLSIFQSFKKRDKVSG